METGDGVRHRPPAEPERGRQRHAVEETVGRRLGRVDVAVLVEPDDRIRRLAGDRAARGQAVAGQHDREAPVVTAFADLLRHRLADGEAGGDLALVEPLDLADLLDLHVMAVERQRLDQPAGDQRVRPLAETFVPAPAVIGRKDDGEFHVEPHAVLASLQDRQRLGGVDPAII